MIEPYQPGKRAPTSQPLDAEVAFQMMGMLGSIDQHLVRSPRIKRTFPAGRERRLDRSSGVLACDL